MISASIWAVKLALWFGRIDVRRSSPFSRLHLCWIQEMCSRWVCCSHFWSPWSDSTWILSELLKRYDDLMKETVLSQSFKQTKGINQSFNRRVSHLCNSGELPVFRNVVAVKDWLIFASCELLLLIKSFRTICVQKGRVGTVTTKFGSRVAKIVVRVFDTDGVGLNVTLWVVLVRIYGFVVDSFSSGNPNRLVSGYRCRLSFFIYNPIFQLGPRELLHGRALRPSGNHRPVLGSAYHHRLTE